LADGVEHEQEAPMMPPSSKLSASARIDPTGLLHRARFSAAHEASNRESEPECSDGHQADHHRQRHIGATRPINQANLREKPYCHHGESPALKGNAGQIDRAVAKAKQSSE
jgi:hypothetical protein